MSYTLGASTTDDITMTSGASMGANGQISAVGGWFYPTTLTAGRYLIGRAAVIGLSIDATTTSLRFITDHTTDGEYTAPVGLVVDQWQWFAVLLSTSNALTPPEAIRLWVADARTPPTEVTVTTAVTPVGNSTGSTSWTIGNRGSTASVAFQGQVAEQWCWSSVTGSLFGQPASIGTITDAQADMVRRHFLTPLWRGRPEELLKPFLAQSQIELSYWPGLMDVGSVSGSFTGQFWNWMGATPGYGTGLYQPPVYSQNQPPFRSIGNWGIPALVME